MDAVQFVPCDSMWMKAAACIPLVGIPFTMYAKAPIFSYIRQNEADTSLLGRTSVMLALDKLVEYLMIDVARCLLSSAACIAGVALGVLFGPVGVVCAVVFALTAILNGYTAYNLHNKANALRETLPLELDAVRSSVA